MTTSAEFIFYLTCLSLGKMVQTTDLDSSSVHQGNRFLSVQTGGNLTLKCFHEAGTAAKLYWIKDTVGQKPRLISSSYSVQGSSSNIPTLIHQSPSETIQPGGSVTLNCTVQTGTCDGQHSVYWFKDSEESHPALIYTDGGSTDQCERKANTQTHTCDYNLPMESLNLSHAGTYYCAVASCGHILFGNGTKLNFKDEKDSRILVYFLSGALTFTIILNVFLVFLLCMMNKRNHCEVTESHARCSAPFTPNAEGEQNEANIQYAAVRELKISRSRRQRNNLETECTYSTIKQ
uniref:uncharacterized protein LOC120822524 isoform X2 n=1 Tax=Gasterosteus aculeatus aculeatus TaxID=481459 RepID=UPI001A987785|nr:uncharacterized protein LOC120822524 isoform X2 [Gasterosteus aculeatus aculeatus]